MLEFDIVLEAVVIEKNHLYLLLIRTQQIYRIYIYNFRGSNVMIKLKKINVQYKKIIIKDGELEIPSGKITSIIGESGSGKSTLLYLLGLISENQDYEYFYKGQLLDFSDTEWISQIRRNKIGFLFQDNSLIETLTIAENMRMIASLAGYEITDVEIDDHLLQVGLAGKKEQYPLQLSGGELQRAALANLLVKKPEIILADEPTSALDQVNQEMTWELFEELKKQGTTIVIATHSKEIYAQSDWIYKIQDTQIVKWKGEMLDDAVVTEIEQNEVAMDKKYSLPVKQLLCYVRNNVKKKRILKTMLIGFCACAIAGFVLTNGIVEGLNKNQADLMNQISDREIFLVNQTFPDDLIRDCDENLSITDEELKKINEISTIDEIIPYYEFRSFCLNTDYRRLKTDVYVKTDVEEKNVLFDLAGNPQTYFIVMPYSDDAGYADQLYKEYKTNDTGVYLSYDMAEMLGLLQNEETVFLDFEIGMPVYIYEDVFYDENEKMTNMDLDLLIFEEIQLQVAGIMEQSVVNRYSINGNNVIYMPYTRMEELRISANAEGVEEQSDFIVKDWRPSAYLIYTKNYMDVKSTQTKLQNINSNFVARSDYQDTTTMYQMIEDLNVMTTTVIYIFLTILFVLMSAIFINDTWSRKREFALLKVNGMKKREFLRLIIVESLMQGVKIALSAGILILCLSWVVNSLLFGGKMIMINLRSIMYVITISTLFIMIPAISSIIFVTSLQPDQVLRDK